MNNNKKENKQERTEVSTKTGTHRHTREALPRHGNIRNKIYAHKQNLIAI